MSSLTRATAADLPKLLPMIAAYHASQGIATTPEQRQAAVEPLLAGTPLGAVWMIGPRMAPVGYIAAGMGWSIELGGPDAFVDEFYIREAVRGRGIGAAALDALATDLRDAGIVALHLEVASGNDRAQKFYTKRGFGRREGYSLMTRSL